MLCYARWGFLKKVVTSASPARQRPVLRCTGTMRKSRVRCAPTHPVRRRVAPWSHCRPRPVPLSTRIFSPLSSVPRLRRRMTIAGTVDALQLKLMLQAAAI
jgi:hypothetical protein